MRSYGVKSKVIFGALIQKKENIIVKKKRMKEKATIKTGYMEMRM
jgi:hypothetical protein